jgi:hypothetical protein
MHYFLKLIQVSNFLIIKPVKKRSLSKYWRTLRAKSWRELIMNSLSTGLNPIREHSEL